MAAGRLPVDFAVGRCRFRQPSSPTRTRRPPGGASNPSATRPTSRRKSPSISRNRPTCRNLRTRSPERWRNSGIGAAFVALDELPERLVALGPKRDRDDRLDADRRGALLSRLVRSGAGATARISLATAARRPPRTSARTSSRALRSPPPPGSPFPRPCSWTARRRSPRSAAALPRDRPLFVKPNTLGAKIGIFADSLLRRSCRGGRARGAHPGALPRPRARPAFRRGRRRAGELHGCRRRFRRPARRRENCEKPRERDRRRLSHHEGQRNPVRAPRTRRARAAASERNERRLSSPTWSIFAARRTGARGRRSRRSSRPQRACSG